MDRKRITAVSLTLLLGSAIGLAATAGSGDDYYRFSTAPPALHGITAGGGDEGGVASQPCGDAAISQSNSLNIFASHTVQCHSQGIPADNGLARSFALADDTSICGVTFGIESTDGVGPWPVTVRLYEGDISGPFSGLTLRGSTSVVIPPNTAQQHFAAIFDEPVLFADGEKMVVELFIKSRAVADGGDGGKMFLGSNNLGQSAPSYVRAPACNIHNFITYASIGHPQVHVVMEVYTNLPAGACCIDGAPCPADLTGNGSVGVPDLLELLSQWGACPPQPQDCPADLTGNGSVGVPDLLELLSQWGACPEGGGSTICEELSPSECAAAGGEFHGSGTTCLSPSECPVAEGACCLGYGACQPMTPMECDQNGGEFKGNGTSCVGMTCDLGPPCPEGAIDEGEPCGEDNNGGCNSVPPAYTPISCDQTVCGSAWADDNERDTDWYTVTITEQRELVWSVESPFQAQVAILNDQCGEGLEELAAGESEPGSNVTTASACLPPGTYRLFVAIDDFENHPCGSGMNNYVASLSCSGCEVPEPEGETCDDAIPIAIGEIAIGNNVGNDWEVDVYCDDFIEPESGVLWFEVVGDGNELTAFNANLPGTVLETQMYVYCGTCEAPGCIGQQVSHPNAGAAYRWCSEAGHTYYLAVWGILGGEGDISMSVSSGNSCSAEPCEAGGLCAGICGGQAPSGCWCDNTCHLFDDCCAGLCNDCPEAAACNHECAGLCGQQAPSGCWCDAECAPFGDCCEGVCDVCPDLPACDPPSCAGLCGGGYPAGCFDDLTCDCFCDEECWIFGDCCNDVCDECPDLEFCP